MGADDVSNVERWSSPDFLDEARDWVRSACQDRGVELDGFVQPHCRPWSSAICFDTSQGPLWFPLFWRATRIADGRLPDTLVR